MEAFLTSTAIVAVAEMGDKTQLLSFVLAARFRRPWPIIAGRWSSGRRGGRLGRDLDRAAGPAMGRGDLLLRLRAVGAEAG